MEGLDVGHLFTAVVAAAEAVRRVLARNRHDENSVSCRGAKLRLRSCNIKNMGCRRSLQHTILSLTRLMMTSYVGAERELLEYSGNGVVLINIDPDLRCDWIGEGVKVCCQESAR